MSNSVNLLVVAVILINILACLWLMWATARAPTPSAAKKDDATTNPGTTGHVWDENLVEANNPMPRWWLGLFMISIVFGLVYLLLYPGLGTLFTGKLNWTETKEWRADSDAARDLLEKKLAPLKNATIAELARDGGAMSLAANLFAANCSTCHGSDARGAKGFPNLTDGDWLYGGDPETIYQTIANGRNGMMPALGAVLGKDGVKEVASYVLHLSGHKAPQEWVDAGKTRFDTICAACHGPEGKGMAALGAPNLTDNIWLHGGDYDTVVATITSGRNSQMPAHLPLLGETKVRLLAAYVVSLSSGQSASGKSSAGKGGDVGAP